MITSICQGGDDIRLETLTAAGWDIPRVGETTPVPIALRITNLACRARMFNLMDTIDITLVDGSGIRFPMDGGRDGTTATPPLSDLVAPDGELVVEKNAALLLAGEGTLRLVGDDGFGGQWYIDGLLAGDYTLHVTLSNKTTHGERGDVVWTGTALAPPIKVQLEVR